MSIPCIKIRSLGEYYDVIGSLERTVGEKNREQGSEKNVHKRSEGQIQMMWFRAQPSVSYSLIPSLYRKQTNDSVGRGAGEMYTGMHYQEEMRLQHYQAKNYHYFTTAPTSRIGWIEGMQHHGVSTRALDWSESSGHSLLFALEPFINRKSEDHHNRHRLSPCVWVLDPNGLNLEILRIIQELAFSQPGLLEETYSYSQDEKDDLKARIQSIFKSIRQVGGKETSHIDFIVNLNEIENEVDRNRFRMRQLLLNGTFNPLHYFLARVYSDGYPIENHALPPLAVVEPYHSERIKAQKGVFTIFPFYAPDPHSEKYKKAGFNPDAMSYHSLAQKHLYKLILMNPQKMAQEALASGMNESWLYPEMPVVSSEIESRIIY